MYKASLKYHGVSRRHTYSSCRVYMVSLPRQIRPTTENWMNIHMQKCQAFEQGFIQDEMNVRSKSENERGKQTWMKDGGKGDKKKRVVVNNWGHPAMRELPLTQRYTEIFSNDHMGPRISETLSLTRPYVHLAAQIDPHRSSSLLSC